MLLLGVTDTPLDLITKTCQHCNLTKAIEEFAKSYSKRKDGTKVLVWANSCKKCKSARDSGRIKAGGSKVSPRANAPVTIQVLRARLFLSLIYSGHDDVAAQMRVDQIYPTWKRDWVR